MRSHLRRFGLPVIALSALGFLATLAARAEPDPLPSWNETPTKQAIIRFVRETTDRSSARYVPPEGRIATFDQDGTTWVSHPVYTQLVFCLDRVSEVAAKHPELRSAEPFRTVLSGDRAAIARLSRG